MTFDNRTSSDLTEASLEAALVAIRRDADENGNRITIKPTCWVKPPGMTNEEFEGWRQRWLAQAAPEIRRMYGCIP